jgi:hypothetical protein
MNELITQNGINFQQGSIEFNGFDGLRSRAISVASLLDELEVTEDNVKLIKKDIAFARKELNRLDSARKEVKREILKPYDAFANQLSSISDIVKEAEDRVRVHVREIEEKERASKENEIIDIWYKKVINYQNIPNDMYDFFIESRHLNKSTSINTIEKEIVQFLERVKSEMEILSTMDSAEALLKEYVCTGDFKNSIKRIEEAKNKLNMEYGIESVKSFNRTIRVNKSNIEKVKMLLELNDIEYELG